MYIRIDDVKIHYKVAGQGEPVVLLHGWGRNAESFAWLVKILESKFKVYSLDLPGFGLSSQPLDIIGSKEYAKIVANFIDALKIVNPILIGHSFGGKIIINLMADGIVEAKKIVLISSAGVRLKKSFKTSLKIFYFKCIKYLMYPAIIKKIFYRQIEVYKKRFGSNDYRNSRGLMRAILVKIIQEDLTSLLPKINAPVLLLWGDLDKSTPLAAGKIMHHLIPKAELKVFHGSGHFPFMDNYVEFIVELKKFLELPC
jgi:pimeloyl-ACP methyl ester carboxylesterase